MKTRLFLAVLAIAAMASCTVEVPQTAPVPDTRKVLRASFDDDGTRTTLAIGPSTAQVLWEGGDQIMVVGLMPAGGYYRRAFTTSNGGSVSAEFACDNWSPNPEVEHYCAMYPAGRFFAAERITSSTCYLGIVFPPVQQAVKGGVERGLLLSVADQRDKLSGELKFSNIVSLVRFRMTGRSASKVKTVKFVTTTVISGDGVCVVSDSEPYVDLNIFFPPIENDPSSSVTLTGSFEADEDYFIVIPPCVTEGFSIIFMDEEGNSISRLSSKTVEFKRSRIADLGTIVLDEEFGASSDKVVKYMECTSGFKPVVLPVLADGFTASQQDLFLSLAKSAIDKLFDTEPYKTYKKYFTVYLLPVVSNEAGASVIDDSGTITTKVDNYFGSGWSENYSSNMDADDGKVRSYLESVIPELVRGSHSISEVPAALIINDSRYGGICHISYNGYAYALVPYSYSGEGIQWSYPTQCAASDSDPSAGVRKTTKEEKDALGYNTGDWRNTFIHEYGGHAIGRLLDEYWYDSYDTSSTLKEHDWPVPLGLNISAVYDNVPWKGELLDNMSVLSTIDSRYPDRIGRFQGGDVSILNRWRSEQVSCMIDNRQYFSAWQRILIVKRIMSLAGDSFSMSDFLDKDVTLDPVRDGAPASSARLGAHTSPLRFAPPLAPPVLHGPQQAVAVAPEVL
ncbi:MAG: hypothetical protein J5640_06440 [Bacteroidales bacterium]|nr:hypothetical protein [Bacteroidales bacterium]